jgi:hypothetical protein
MRPAVALLLAAFGSGAQAGGDACTPGIEAALRGVGGKTRIRGELAASDCRPWPAGPGGTMAAVMAFEKPGSGDRNELEWQVVVALVDPARGKTLNSHRIALQEDATTLLTAQSLSLDLAPYWLKAGVRALGLRFSSDRSNNVANSRSGAALHLYAPEGKRLRPVFCQAMGWQDAGLGVIGQDAWDEAQTTLSLLDPQTSGWRRLRLTDQISHQTRDGEASPPKPSHRECRFDGSAYRCDPPRSAAITDCDPAGL